MLAVHEARLPHTLMTFVLQLLFGPRTGTQRGRYAAARRTTHRPPAPRYARLRFDLVASRSSSPVNVPPSTASDSPVGLPSSPFSVLVIPDSRLPIDLFGARLYLSAARSRTCSGVRPSRLPQTRIVLPTHERRFGIEASPAACRFPQTRTVFFRQLLLLSAS